MKSKTCARIMALALFAALAVPALLTAQEQNEEGKKATHHQ